MASKVSKSVVDAPTLKKFINEVKTTRKDIFAGDNLGNTLMHQAAARNKPEFIRWMAEQGVGVNYVNKMQMTPLHMACMFGHNEAVEELIDLGAVVNCSNIHGLTPLHYTCMRMNEPSTIKLLNNGANQHALSNDQQTPFKMSRTEFLTQLMYMANQDRIVSTFEQPDTTPLVKARREFSFGEIKFSKSMTQTLIAGKMGRLDPYYSTTIEDEEVTIRRIHMPGINAVNREKFNDHLVEMKFADHLNILGIIGMVSFDVNSVGVIIRSQSMPYLRDLIEYNKGDEEMQMWLKVCVARDMIKATAHIYATVDTIERDFEISPDTIQVDAKKGVAYLEMVTRSSIEGLSHFAPQPEFMAPERIVKGTVNYDLNNEHSFCIGALFHYMVRGGTAYPGQDAQSIAEKMCYHYGSQDEIYSEPIFAIKLNNDLLRSLTTVNLSHRVQIYILDDTNVFSILVEKVLEDDEFLRPFEGVEEELQDIPSSRHHSESRSMHHDTDEDDDEEEEDEEEEDEENEDESDARSMNSRSSRKSQASDAGSKRSERSERSEALRASNAGPRIVRKSIESEYISTAGDSKRGDSVTSKRDSKQSSMRDEDKRKSSNSQSDADSQRRSLASQGNGQDDNSETDSSSSENAASKPDDADSINYSRRYSKNDSEKDIF